MLNRFKKLYLFTVFPIAVLYIGSIVFYYISYFFLTLAYYPTADKIDNAQDAYKVGKIYQSGDRITRNPDKAKLYFQKAAELGLIKANAHLAELYVKGRIDLPEEIVVDIATKALETEEAPRANYALGKIYANKDSKYYNLDTAENFYLASANAGSVGGISAIIHFYNLQKFNTKQYKYWRKKDKQLLEKYMAEKVFGYPHHISEWYLN